jgi:biotin operon repressor
MGVGDITLTNAAARLGITRTALRKRLIELRIFPQRIGPSKVLFARQYAAVEAAVQAAINQDNESIALEVAARCLSMSRVTLGRRMKDLKIESKRVGTSKRITSKQMAKIEAYDSENSRRRPAKDARKQEGI